jgi:hypothetical protein
MAFRVGQKVVCVDDRCDDNGWSWQWLTRGQVYTIKSFAITFNGNPGVHLVEVVRDNRDAAFRQSRFRPVVDISDLQAIVREQLLGKPRHIAPDKFDKQRIHSAAPVADGITRPPSGDATARSVFAPSPDRATSPELAGSREQTASQAAPRGETPAAEV